MWKALTDRIGEKELKQVHGEEGYCVLDGVFDEDVIQTFKKEIVAMQEDGNMHPNQVQYATAGGKILLTKPGVFEADIHDALLREKCPVIEKLFDEMEDLQTHIHNDLPVVVGDSKYFTLKLQYNDGTGSVPFHYDNIGKPNKRCVTCLLYLNENWKEGDGGELLLLPFLKKPIIVPPLGNRIVLFRSDFVLHAVLKSHKPRYLFTVWLDGEQTNQDDEVNLRAKHLTPSSIPILENTPLQRSLSRAVYSDKYEESIIECFGEGTRDCKYAVALHRAFVKQLVANPSLATFIDILKDRRLW